jgi:hypothetical protein
MSQANMEIIPGVSASAKRFSQSDLPERRLRRAAALLILYLLIQAEFGLAWDRSWHDYLGRNQFLIPPHIMSYSGIGLTGLVALTLVLSETVRYYQRKPGVDVSSTIQVLRVFAAPTGFVMLGFGTLIDLIAAPLDNYWHTLYGIDVTWWSPFHLMGLTGSIFAGVGLIYVFASEAAIARTSEHVPRRCFCLSGAVQLTRKIGSASMVALFVWGIAPLLQLFVWWALHASSTFWHIPFRYAQEPVLNVVFIALLLDGVFAWQNRKKRVMSALQSAWLIGLLMAIMAVFVPTGIARLLHLLVPGLAFPPDVYQAVLIDTTWPTLLWSLLLTLLVGLASALAGSALGAKWHWNKC